MTGTLISLISIFLGIIGANSTGFILKKYSLGVIGNTIIGVFGSIFLIKTFGRLGFNPLSIIQGKTFSVSLFLINCMVSLFGGGIAVILITKLKNNINKKI